MARDHICMECGMKFPSDAAFQEHKKSGHKTPGESILPAGVDLPNPELVAMIQRLEKEPEKQPDGATSAPAVAPPPPSPIVLTYVYTGNCPNCNVSVNTIELDIELDKEQTKHFAVATCPNCKKQLSSREVAKL